MYRNSRWFPSPILDIIAKALASGVLLALLGGISIPLEGELDFTLQTLLVLLPAVLFGWEVALLGTLAYIIVGCLGLPVFPGGGSGWRRILGPYGGFYFGFLMAAAVCGFLAERPKFQSWLGVLGNFATGHVIILLAGFGWLWSVVWQPGGLDGWGQLEAALPPLLPGLVVKCAFGALVVELVRKAAHRVGAR